MKSFTLALLITFSSMLTFAESANMDTNTKGTTVSATTEHLHGKPKNGKKHRRNKKGNGLKQGKRTRSGNARI